jgi:hypothetical protein
VFRLMKKFAFAYFWYMALILGLFYPLYNLDRITGPRPLDLSFGYWQAIQIFWVIFAAMWMQEQIEFKSNGYKFLRTLPLKNKDIVGAKFIVVFASVFFYVSFYCIAFAFISSAPEYFNPSCKMMINMGMVCLIIAGLLHMGIIKFGYMNFGKFLLILMILGLVIPMLVTTFLLPKIGLTRYDVLTSITSVNWMLVTAVGLVVYFGIMRMAMKMKNFELT